MIRGLSALLMLSVMVTPCWAGASRLFDGTNDCLGSTSTIAFSANVITVSFWLYWDAFANDDDLAAELTTNYNSNAHTFLVDPNAGGGPSAGFYQLSIHGALAGEYRAESFARPSAATWHHMAVVFDNSTDTGDVKVYVDGVEASTTIDSNTKASNGNFATDTVYLMSRACSSLFGAGRMAYFAIHNRELTLREVNEIMRNPNAIPDGKLTAPPLHGNASPEIDLSGNGETFDVTGATESFDGPPVFLTGSSP